jgi:diguanylate cyclase
MKLYLWSNLMDAVALSLGGTIKAVGHRIFGKSTEPTPNPTGELSRYRAIMQSIGDLMLRYVIEPNPANYSLAYRHLIAQEPRLGDAMEKLIESGYAPSQEAFDDHAVTENQLNEIADRAQENLKAVEELYRKSCKDTKGFGAALEGSANALAIGSSAGAAIGDLIALTRSMIAKTRDAEEELRLRGQAMTDMQMSLSEARVKADTDALTGLANRRAFERHLGAAGARAAITKEPLSLAICDIDFFKAINDNHGHDAGDRVLQYVSDLLRESCGQHGSVSRHGGEEFVVVFEGTTGDNAYEIIDAARRDLGNRKIINKETGLPLGPITFSAGVSCYREQGELSWMLRSADRALYKAKASGRNCVMMTGSAQN